MIWPDPLECLSAPRRLFKFVFGKKQLFGKADCTEYYAKYQDVLSKLAAKPNHPNITKEERKVPNDLRKYGSHMVLTADKGVTIIIMDEYMYIEMYAFAKQ